MKTSGRTQRGLKIKSHNNNGSIKKLERGNNLIWTKISGQKPTNGDREEGGSLIDLKRLKRSITAARRNV